MKTLILTLTVLLTVIGASAQKVSENKVPQAVRSAFQKLYPSASKVKWEREKENYEAGFEWNDVEQSVLLNARGTVLETETEIPVTDLPDAVLKYITQHHKDEKIEEAAKITDAKGNVTYEVEIKGKDLLFDTTGNLLLTKQK